jgi:MFS transporter, DHA2 family, multidrug resistance protein
VPALILSNLTVPDEQPHINPWLIALAVVLPTFMEVLDTSIASVALPHIAGSLSASTDEATWVLTSYLVANAVVLPASNWFALRLGRKRFLMFCIMLFTVASFACGAAVSLGMILFARAVQGAGGGALQPLSQAILMESFPPEKRGQAMAAFGLGVVVAPIVGPTLGGWLTDHYSWRWAFYINIPVGIVALVLISRFIFDPPYVRDAKPGRIDAIGLGLLALWLGALQVMLDKGQEVDWFGAVWMRWGAAVLIVGFAAFLCRELCIANPIVDLRVLLNRNFGLGSLLIGLFGAVIYGIIALLPLFYQTLMGYTASAAGLAVSPRGIGAVLIMPVIGVLTSKVDNRYLIAAGFGTFGFMSLWFGRLNLQMSQWSLLWPIIISGAAAGMVFIPLSTTAMGTLSNRQMGNASGIYNLLRNIGGSIGISLQSTLVARHEQLRRAELAGRLSASNPAFDHVYNNLHNFLWMRRGSGLLAQRTYDMIQHTLDRQAALLSYVDDFRYLAMGCFACVPIVFLLKKVVAKRGATPAAH